MVSSWLLATWLTAAPPTDSPPLPGLAPPMVLEVRPPVSHLEEKPPVVEPERSRGVSASLSLGAITEGGAQPQSLLGVSLGTRVGAGRWSGVLESWFVFPTTLTVSGSTSIDAWSLGGTGGGCGEVDVESTALSACVLARVGAMQLRGRHVEVSPQGWVPLVAAGARLHAEWPRDRSLGVFVSLELWAPLLRTRLATAETTVWSQPWVFGGAVVGALARLP